MRIGAWGVGLHPAPQTLGASPNAGKVPRGLLPADAATAPASRGVWEGLWRELRRARRLHHAPTSVGRCRSHADLASADLAM